MRGVVVRDRGGDREACLLEECQWQVLKYEGSTLALVSPLGLISTETCPSPRRPRRPQ